MKAMSDRKWVAIIIFALLLEIMWLLTDLKWLNLTFVSKQAETTGEIEAGHVVKTKSDLKRRGGNSLAWEPANEKDILYYKDSVLTLAQSTAKLYLNDKTELELSENTLVTLEQPDDKSRAEIRLRFSKGDLKARNPSAKAKIEGGEWVVNLEKGAEVSLRKNKDNYEFEILSGRATLQTEKGIENLQDSKILKLGENQKIEQIEKSKELQWADKKPQRLYTFDDAADVPVQWTGAAKELQINKSGEGETKELLKTDQQATNIRLVTGNYKIRLKDEGGLSEAKEVEVWKAPKIYPKKPLPRDRLSAGSEQEFVWSSESGVQKYVLKLTGKSGTLTKEATENFIKVKLEDVNQDITWSVEGIDADGNVIPALQQNKVFIRQDPLQAPKLKTPEIHEIKDSEPATSPKPSEPGAFHWWQILETDAEAAQMGYEITFEWEPVSGAENYTIEISTDPEFKIPEVSVQTKTQNYKWQNFKPQKKYYWRVAAGSSRRMGVFSEPAEVKPIKAVKILRPTPKEKAIVEVKLLSEQNTIAEKNRIAEENKRAEEKEKPQAILTRPLAFGFALMPTYKLLETAIDSSSKANLSGAVPAGIQIEFFKDDYHFRINGTIQSWKAKPESDFPLQDELQIVEAWAFLSKATWGLALHQSFQAERKNLGSISTTPILNLGVRYAVSNEFGLSALSAGKSSELAFDYEYKFYLTESAGSKFYIGPGLHFFYLINKEGNGSNTNLSILLGADNF